ncbi:MAG: winged helix DNA-binding domain-containing protein [Chloroflexi bacterium]|nr:winged helix DNA-binding domain-containing protein [Chloroflexota bacterium]
MTSAEISLSEARQMVLAAQGFGNRSPTGQPGSVPLGETATRLGAIQIDSVNVVVRSHYMPLFSRLGPYPMGSLDDLAHRQRSLFEYWGHEASLIPTSLYPLFRHRMEDAKPHSSVADFLNSAPQYIESVFKEIQERGPLIVSELSDPGQRTGPWWGYNNGKIALEWLFATGRLATADRRNFARVYDLAERVIPSEHLNAPAIPAKDAIRELLQVSAKALGIGTARDIADYYRIRPQAAREPLRELEEDGLLARVLVEGWNEPAYVHSSMHSGTTVTDKLEASAILSPFDSLIWNRDRVERLFGFRYRIEIYVPEAARQFGYYVMPFLMGDQLVARVDLKADRRVATLMVKSAHLEAGQDSGLVAGELAPRLNTMSQWLGLERVEVGRVGNLNTALRAAMRNR